MHQSSIDDLKYTLGKDFYTSSETFELEKRQIFSNNWICIGLSNQLPKCGGMLAVDFINTPILLVRQKSGDIQAFHNLCSHRGIQLVANPCKHSDRIVCPYHAWSYSLDGKLQSTPYFKGFGKDDDIDLDKASSKDLKSVFCKEWLGLIFINLSEKANSFESYIDPIKKRWSSYNLTELRYATEINYDVAANWKLALENFSENYHFPFVHPHLNEYSKMEDHYTALLENDLMIQGVSSYCPEPENGEKLPVFSNLTSKWNTTAEYTILFPNLMIGVHPDHTWFLIVEPITVTTSRERLIFCFVNDQSLDSKFSHLRNTVIKRWDKINREDIVMVERLQKGHFSPKFDGGCFSPSLEKALQHFHHQIRESLQARNEC